MSEPLQVPDYSQDQQQLQVQQQQQQQHQYQQQQQQQHDDIAATETGSASLGGLNETLNTDHLDIPVSDASISAMITRFIASCVGKCFTPHQILVFLRLLKAITFCNLILNIFAAAMYILFVDIMASDVVTAELGGNRDMILRLYALMLSVMAIFLELDVINYVRHFSGFKSFIPRALLLYFISIITTTVPLSTANYTDDDYDTGYNDDDIAERIAAEIPDSAVVFQIVTSWIL